MNRTDKEAEEVGSLFNLPDVDLPFGLQLRVSSMQQHTGLLQCCSCFVLEATLASNGGCTACMFRVLVVALECQQTCAENAQSRVKLLFICASVRLSSFMVHAI